MRFIAALFVMTLLSSPVQAKDPSFHSSRVRLLMHSKLELNDDIALLTRFVPAGNLMGELAPLAYIGTAFQVNDNLSLVGYTGWVFGSDEPMVSATINLTFGNFWVWTGNDVLMRTMGGYYFAQAQYQLLSWLHAGVEGEGWGNYEDSATWSHGVGPNLLIRSGKVGTDITVHLRKLNEELKPEFFLRVHLFL